MISLLKHFQVLELGRPVTQLELFDRTHKRKGGKGDFIDNKSKRVRVSLQIFSFQIFSFFLFLVIMLSICLGFSVVRDDCVTGEVCRSFNK